MRHLPRRAKRQQVIDLLSFVAFVMDLNRKRLEIKPSTIDVQMEQVLKVVAQTKLYEKLGGVF